MFWPASKWNTRDVPLLFFHFIFPLLAAARRGMNEQYLAAAAAAAATESSPDWQLHYTQTPTPFLNFKKSTETERSNLVNVLRFQNGSQKHLEGWLHLETIIALIL